MKRSSLPINLYFKNIRQIPGFSNIWSQRSKIAPGRLEQWKIYPNLVNQCYLHSEVTIYYEQLLFKDEQII